MNGTSSNSNAVSWGRNKLLLLEDDALVGEVILGAAAKLIIEGRRVGSIAAFREAYTSFTPNLLVLDLLLGAEDVCPILEFLNQRRCIAPIFFISGYSRRLRYTVSDLARSYELFVVESFEKQGDGVRRLIQKLNAYVIR